MQLLAHSSGHGGLFSFGQGAKHWTGGHIAFSSLGQQGSLAPNGDMSAFFFLRNKKYQTYSHNSNQCIHRDMGVCCLLDMQPSIEDPFLNDSLLLVFFFHITNNTDTHFGKLRSPGHFGG